MGVGLNGTITGTGATGSVSGQSIAFLLDFAGVASVDIEMQMPSGAWIKFLTGIVGDFYDSFQFPVETTLRLNCTAFTNNVEYKMAPGIGGASKPVDAGMIYPLGAVPVNVTSGNVANAIASATMPAVAGKTNYCTGFKITGAGATAALPVIATLTGTLGGNPTYTYGFAAGALVGNQPLIVDFWPPLPALAVNTAIVVSCPAGGAGNTHNSAQIHGFVK